jgi:RNA polymerase sigma-70 factor (ECF subfamily)
MERVLRGDQGGFAELMSRYERRIYNFCLRYVGNEEDAREAFQETFYRVYTKADRFTPRYRFSTWVYTIARNQCLDRLRKRSRRREESFEEISESEPGRLAAALNPGDHVPADDTVPTGNPREQMEEKELDAKLREAVAKLPAAQREVILLRHDGGFTFAEIAESLGCSVGTAKSRFHFGFRKLARLLQPLARET